MKIRHLVMERAPYDLLKFNIADVKDVRSRMSIFPALSLLLCLWPCSHGYDILPFYFGPFQKVVRRGVAFTRVRKNQAVRSKAGPEIGWYGKVNQKLERCDIVPFRSRVNRSGTISYRFPDLFGIYG